MTAATESASGRRVPASMVVIAALLVAGFGAIATFMAFTVTNGAPPPPAVADLPLPGAVEVMASHMICRSEACDGQGAVVRWDPVPADVAVGLLVTRFEAAGWAETDVCPEGGRCLTMDDLRVVVRAWAGVEAAVGAVMRTAIREQGLDDSEFVYVKVTRCGTEGC